MKTNKFEAGETSTVADEWQNFKAAVFDRKPSNIQEQEMKRAFYAGFYSCLAVTFQAAEKELDEAAEFMEGLKAECGVFFKSLTQN